MTNAYAYQGLPQNFLDKCHIENGEGNTSTTFPERSYLSYDGNSLNADFFMPYKESLFQQAQHWCGTNDLYGAGTGPYSWYFPEINDQLAGSGQENYLSGIPQNESIDKLQFSFVDRFTFYPCEYSEFLDLEFKGEIEFYHQNKTKKFTEFKFEESNKYEYNAFDSHNGHWSVQCAIGFKLEFDFTGFESLSLSEWNGGDWDRTGFKLTLDEFEREDGLNFGNTRLPFNGVDFFSFGTEYQSINSVQAGFVIKSGTLLLSLATFALAIASTPYWNPIFNQIKGASK